MLGVVVDTAPFVFWRSVIWFVQARCSCSCSGVRGPWWSLMLASDAVSFFSLGVDPLLWCTFGCYVGFKSSLGFLWLKLESLWLLLVRFVSGVFVGCKVEPASNLESDVLNLFFGCKGYLVEYGLTQVLCAEWGFLCGVVGWWRHQSLVEWSLSRWFCDRGRWCQI